MALGSLIPIVYRSPGLTLEGPLAGFCTDTSYVLGKKKQFMVIDENQAE
jgi:hypothetical protein